MLDASTIPLLTKRKFIQALNEDEFRDQVVRPLFLRKGFIHGAELCGPTEAGKDSFFRVPAPFGGDHIAVLQTKIGNLNMGREPSKNVESAATQLRTAMRALLTDTKTKRKLRPNFGYLCSSGQINEQAKNHILDTTETANLTFLDIDDLIPELDKHFPELWYGIKAEKLPYLRRLEDKLLNENEFASLTAVIKSADYDSPVSDTGFVPLKLARTFLRPKNVDGKITQEPEFEETRVEELLTRRERRFLIVGEAGSGKTTLLKRIGEILCREGLAGHSTFVPVLLKAVDIAESPANLAEQILSSTEAVGEGNAAFSVADMEAGNICLLLDAIDEIGTETLFKLFCEKLARFDETYPNCKLIASSRNYSYIVKADRFASYTRFNVSPIGLAEATKIIKNLGKLKLLEGARAKEVMRQLESIHGFELNPLVVTVFAASADSSRRDIPANITELFAKFTEFMLGRWDTQKGLSQQYESNVKALLLQRVAYKMHSEKTTRLPTDEFISLISDECSERGVKEAKIDVLVDEIVNRSTLVRQNDGMTEFRHLLIQEYFAGRAIRDESLLNIYATDEWWMRALVFYFGANPENEQGLRRLCDSSVARTSEELFNIAVTLGLATQACYFVRQRPKAELLEWVIGAMGAAAASHLEERPGESYPIHTFVFCYLTGRDAVAADCVEEIAARMKTLPADANAVSELQEFWLIVGLMESGNLTTALQRIRKFKPKNSLPLLALHMGAILLQHVRAGTKEQKDLAKQIGEQLRPTVAPLLKKYLKEFKTHLIEIQKGRVKELPADSEASVDP